jgi:hypothetical protein
MNKINWKDVAKSFTTVTLYYIGMILSWLLFAVTTLTFLVSYANDFHDLGLVVGLGLFVIAIASWIVAVTITIEVYNTTTERGN